MTELIFTVRDMAAGFYFPTFQAPTRAAALRSFTQIVTDPKSDFAKFPADFALYLCGRFNRETGELESLPLEKIVDASSIIPSHRSDSN